MLKKGFYFLFKTRKGNQYLLLGVLAALSTALCLTYLIDLRMTSLFSPCTFKKLTGFSCISCGMTRATDSLLRGAFLEAFRYNPAYILFLLFCLYLFVRFALRTFRKDFEPFSLKSVKLWHGMAILLPLLVFWVVRNCAFYLIWFYV